MKKILITGANGFIGYHALLYFSKIKEYNVIGTVRKLSKNLIYPSNVKIVNNLDINNEQGWIKVMEGVDIVLHCAATYHISKNIFANNKYLCKKINVEGSILVTKAAINCKVSRFVYLSSLKVHGEENHSDKPFRETDILKPIYSYGKSKAEAEKEILKLVNNKQMEIVIIRPPPVYGPNVPANFLVLLKLIKLGVPLPFSNIYAKRSYVAIANLLEIIRLSFEIKNISGEVFLVSDDNDLTITDLIKNISSGMAKKVKLFNFPVLLLYYLFIIFGLRESITILIKPSIVDTSKAKNLLNWKPVISSNKALLETVNDFLLNNKK